MPRRMVDGARSRGPQIIAKNSVLLPALPSRPFSPQSLDESLRTRLHRLTDAMFLSFAKLGDRVSIWSADNRGMQFQTAALGFEEIRTLSEELLHFLRDPEGNLTWIDSISKRLYDALFAPTEGLFDRDRRLFVHFCDELQFIPLAALKNVQGQYLLDRMSYLTTADFPWNQKGSTPQCIAAEARMLVVDAPDVSHQARRIAGNSAEPDDELFFVASAMPYNDMLAGSSATPNQFLRLAPNAEVMHCRVAVTADSEGPVLHFASETKRPSTRSASPEADGKLRVAVLPRGALARCQLLFLDADYLVRRQGDCPDLWRQTSRALHYSGVRNVVLPLWNTPQPVRAEFTRVFYSTLTAGISVEESIRSASAHVRNCPGWGHPHYWANVIQSTSHASASGE